MFFHIRITMLVDGKDDSFYYEQHGDKLKCTTEAIAIDVAISLSNSNPNFERVEVIRAGSDEVVYKVKRERK